MVLKKHTLWSTMHTTCTKAYHMLIWYALTYHMTHTKCYSTWYATKHGIKCSYTWWHHFYWCNKHTNTDMTKESHIYALCNKMANHTITIFIQMMEWSGVIRNIVLVMNKYVGAVGLKAQGIIIICNVFEVQPECISCLLARKTQLGMTLQSEKTIYVAPQLFWFSISGE